jgi:hypothetical protein
MIEAITWLFGSIARYMAAEVCRLNGDRSIVDVRQKAAGNGKVAEWFSCRWKLLGTVS